MLLDMNEYVDMLRKLKVNIIYSGPMWDDGIKGLAEMVKAHLVIEDLHSKAAKSIFSVFIEQVTNMIMYSAEKEHYPQVHKDSEGLSKGVLVLGQRENVYFVQTRNAIKNRNVDLIKGRIDHLNSLDKTGLRQYYKEQMRGDNENPESKGAGLGLIEIARRATSPLKYAFEPAGEDVSYFTMYVEIAQKEAKHGL